MLTEGYIGITTNTVAVRFKHHKSAAKVVKSKGTIHRALLKYENEIVVSELVIGTLQYCAELEFKLRPTRNIGWNIAVGGLLTSIEARATYSTPLEVRRKQSGAKKGRKLSAEHKAKMSATHKAKPSWLNSHADKSTWLVADVIYDTVVSDQIDSRMILSRTLDIPYAKLKSIFNKIKSRSYIILWCEFYWLPRLRGGSCFYTKFYIDVLKLLVDCSETCAKDVSNVTASFSFYRPI